MNKNNVTSKPQYTYSSETGLFVIIGNNRKYIANFNIEVISRVKKIKSGSTTTDQTSVANYVRFSLEFMDGTTSEKITLPVKGLDKVDWPGVDLRCSINPEFRTAGRHLANIIRERCQDAPEETETSFDRLGTHIVEGIPVFFTGDRLIWPRDQDRKPAIAEPDKFPYKLAYDPNCTEQEAAAGMDKIVSISSEAGRIILAHSLIYLMLEAFITAGIHPGICVFLHGEVSIGKTRLARFMTQLYNRDKPLQPSMRVNASIPAAVKLLYEISDWVRNLDDLFKAGDSVTDRQQRKTLLEITRVIADRVEPGRMRGSELAMAAPRCGILFTGEILIGTGSYAARLFPVKVTHTDSTILTECQEKPLILSTFYNYFIEWYVTNFYEICGLIKQWLSEYRSVKSDIYDRLNETQFSLETAFRLFLTYKKEKGFITLETAHDEYYSFYHQIRAIITEQNVRVGQGGTGEPNQIDYLESIRTLFHQSRFSLAYSVKEFNKGKYDGIIHGEYLFLRCDELMVKIRTLDPHAVFGNVLKCLKLKSAMKPMSPKTKENSCHVFGIKGRFYAIKFSKLK